MKPKKDVRQPTTSSAYFKECLFQLFIRAKADPRNARIFSNQGEAMARKLGAKLK